MPPLLKTIFAAATALVLSMSPATAKVIGIYQSEDRQADYRLETCGNTEDLCVTLVAVRGPVASNPDVLAYVGKQVVSSAKPVSKNVWYGTLKFGQYNLSGNLTLDPGKSFVASGCVLLVVCGEFKLIPGK